MSNERRFSAVNTKIRVLSSNLLRNNQFIELIQKDSLDSQISYLRDKTIYGEFISRSSSIQEVEVQLVHYILHEFEKLLSFFTDSYKEFFKGVIMRYEIEDLKMYIRVLQRGEDKSKISKGTLVSKSYHTIDFETLNNSATLSELIEKLKGTIYYKSLSPFKLEEGTKILFYMEMNLDRLYFENLFQKAKSLSSEDEELVLKSLGRNIDMLNIQWIYRGIKYYKLIPEELINYTLSNGQVFNYKKIKEMCYSTEEGLKLIVLDTKYKFLFDSGHDIDLFMERRIGRYLYYEFIKDFRRAKMDISLFISYIHLLEYEIRDIISILESKRYNLGLEETQEYLLRKIEGSDEQ